MVRTKHATRVAFLIFHVSGHREVIHELLVDVHAARVAGIIFAAVSFSTLLFLRRSVDVVQVATSNGLCPRWAADGRVAGSATHSQPISARSWGTTRCSLLRRLCGTRYAHEKIRGHGTLLDHKSLHVGHWRHALVEW